MDLQGALVKMFTTMADVGSAEDKERLQIQAGRCTLEQWKRQHQLRVGISGGLAGAAGFLAGPFHVAAMGADLTFLVHTCGRACFGIGHILGRELDYETDMDYILGIWVGEAQPASAVASGAFADSVASKVGPELVGQAAVKMTAKVATKVGGKLVPKATTKILPKVAAKAAAKLSAKLATKGVLGAIPGLGAAASGGVNLWLLNDLMDAAETFYRAEYIVLSEDLAA
jgi:EcsC family protein